MARESKLCQIVAVVSAMKTANHAGLTEAHHVKGELITGLTRRYEPKDAEGDPLSPDVKRVRSTGPEVLKEVATEMIRTLNEGNTRARADVVVQGKTILESVPVGHLLYLESRLDDLGTFVEGLPTLDDAEE